MLGFEGTGADSCKASVGGFTAAGDSLQYLVGLALNHVPGAEAVSDGVASITDASLSVLLGVGGAGDADSIYYDKVFKAHALVEGLDPS